MAYDKILERVLQRDEYLVVGKSVARVDALDKALGRAMFTADYISREAVVVKVLRSTEPHARIKGIDYGEALKVPGVLAVLTASVVPGENQIGYALPDQPLLNDRKVHYIGDPIALVCALDEVAASEGLEAVRVEYEPLKPLFDIDSSLEAGAEPIHEGGNIATTTRIRKGDIERGFTEAEVVVEETYETPYQEHMCLEPEAAYAIPEGVGKVTVIGTMQSPFLVREKVAQVLGWSLNRVRVIQALTGGAFGKKDDMGPIVSAMAALAAFKLGRPSALVLDRDESAAHSVKRYPARIRYRSGANGEGKITATEVDITLDCGAYANRAPYWLWRQTVHATGPYEIENVYVDGRAVYTNKVYGGSFRGFGDVAIHFAAESQVDRLAEKLGMDPVDFRLKNVLRPGSRTGCDQLLDHSVGMEECLLGVAEASNWKELRKARRHSGSRVRGLGVGCGFHGISTSRAAPDWSAAYIILNADGTFTYRTGICELGQGSPIGHAKIVAEILGAPLESIRVEGPDTDSTPDARPTHGSRGLMVGGTAAAEAALELRRRMIGVAAEMLGCGADEVEMRGGRAYKRGDPSHGVSFSELAEELYYRGLSPAAYGFYSPPKRHFDPKTGLGVSYSVYTYTATVAEVEVDLETGCVDVLRVWPAMDVGKAVDPLMVEGQIHGAISQGMGFALMERLVVEGGRVLNPNFKDYIIPSSMDMPEVEKPILVESPYRHSAFGAKGVGEPAIISIVPAIANAIHHATGIRFNRLPITPEALYMALRGRGMT
ncbi:xanthine dehydrogenase family protein [Candidatus Bathyarchaeota archaeon]|nr:xanthine dehydrogenase family protein [Candidatus Bathyarchaeota archaeon]